MLYRGKILVSGIAFLALAACAKTESSGLPELPPADSAPSNSAVSPVVDEPTKIGDPYQIDGRTYTPQDVKSYDEVGYASWYGPDFEGQNTANGEVFVSSYISGAHKSLPLPTYVEVTALDTGRTILVRLNDRGPFTNDRLIDLSAGAATLLGISDKGVAPVRVRKVNPPESERAQLRRGGSVAERLPTPESLLKILRSKIAATSNTTPASAISSNAPGSSVPDDSEVAKSKAVEVARAAEKPKAPTKTNIKTPPPETKAVSAQPAKTVTKNMLMVQIGAFSSQSNAENVAKKAGAAIFPSGKVYRVRMGPFANQAEANKGVAQARAKGYSDARIVRAD